jgi:hypothetical protein
VSAGWGLHSGQICGSKLKGKILRFYVEVGSEMKEDRAEAGRWGRVMGLARLPADGRIQDHAEGKRSKELCLG